MSRRESVATIATRQIFRDLDLTTETIAAALHDFSGPENLAKAILNAVSRINREVPGADSEVLSQILGLMDAAGVTHAPQRSTMARVLGTTDF